MVPALLRDFWGIIFLLSWEKETNQGETDFPQFESKLTPLFVLCGEEDFPAPGGRGTGRGFLSGSSSYALSSCYRADIWPLISDGNGWFSSLKRCSSFHRGSFVHVIRRFWFIYLQLNLTPGFLLLTTPPQVVCFLKNSSNCSVFQTVVFGLGLASKGHLLRTQTHKV